MDRALKAAVKDLKCSEEHRQQLYNEIDTIKNTGDKIKELINKSKLEQDEDIKKIHKEKIDKMKIELFDKFLSLRMRANILMELI